MPQSKKAQQIAILRKLKAGQAESYHNIPNVTARMVWQRWRNAIEALKEEGMQFHLQTILRDTRIWRVR